MKLRHAVWLGTIRHSEENSLHKPVLCSVRMDDGAIRRAWVKCIPDREITVEILCALLCDAVGLPVPEPALVRMPHVDHPIQFGSVDASAPTFRHFLQSDTAALTRIKAWPSLVPAACFDDWIANPDRHVGNLLHDGLKQFWLIDHGAAQLDTCATNDIVGKNTLLQVARDGLTPTAVAAKLVPTARGVMQRYADMTVPDACSGATGTSLAGSSAVLSSLEARQPHLFGLVAKRLPQSQRDMFDGTIA